MADRLSRDWNTEVKVKRIRIGFFNRLNLEGALVRDQKKDTLLYAGNLTLRITDWFFLKDRIELEHIGLENSVVNLNRLDSVWNYQFIIDSLAPKKPAPKKKQADIQLFLSSLDLKNVIVTYKDGWVGQDMVGKIGSMELRAKTFDITKKRIRINSLVLNEPSFYTLDYDGNKPSSGTKKPKPVTVKNNELQWNTEGWDIAMEKFSIRNGTVSVDRRTERKTLDYFDPAHVMFSGITGTATEFKVIRDTLSGKIDLKAKERSGLTVSRLKANMKFHPRGMIFTNLDLQTPNSRLRDYYAMRYDSFNKDMANFVDSVNIEASFSNSKLSSKDIAYFAPELKDLNKDIALSGRAAGTVSNFTATKLRAQYGKDTYITGNLSMKGLPDIDRTLITLRQGEFRTTYADAVQLIPSLKKITEPDLASLQFIRFNGDFSGYTNNFTTKGNIQTALGNVYTDVNMKIPAKGAPVYAGIVRTSGFQLGKLLGQANIGTIAFNGEIKGSGFETSGAIELKGRIDQIGFNGYTYQNVVLNGKLLKKEFTGEAIIDDPNAKATLNGYFNLNDPKMPELNATADIQRANLDALNFTKERMSVLGKFKVNVLGTNIDDFIGEASLFDVALTKNDEVFVFDTLYLYAMNVDESRQLELRNADISLIMNGKFKLSEVPATINSYLSNYYPTYFTRSAKPVADQAFTIRADVSNIDQYLKLFNKKLSGFDYSSIQAAIDTRARIFKLNANVPQAGFGKYLFQDFVFEGDGDMDSLGINATAGTIIVNDSLQFPSTSLKVSSSRDVSNISLSTSANQTINSANLSASVTNLTDGVRIQFHPSTIVLNDKTWRIEKDGELTISKSYVDASEIRMTNGEQQLLISSIPSEIGNSRDIIAELRKVNLGDILPFVLQEPRIQGITSGEITIEDPLNKFKVYVNAQTEQTRFENDSIGITTLNGYFDQANDKVSFNLDSDNPDYVFNIDGKIDLADSAKPKIDALIKLDDTRLSILETYLSSVFSKMDGKASGKINVQGNANTPDLIGDVRLSNAGVMVDYTQVYYTLDDTEIRFRPGLLDIGEITITDPLGNKGKVSGNMEHNFFRNMKYNFRASSGKMLVLNTNRVNNDIFYGKAVAQVNFLFSGPQENMRMYINGAPVDSSNITIVTSGTSKQSGEVDYIVWREYGREMNADSLKRSNSNLSMDLDLSASNLLRMTVVLDPITGDSITATGTGNLKILTGTREAMTMNGRFNIERGRYNFNFQDIFNKPFTIEPNSGSFISWTGSPYDADININATYVAEKVRMSTLFEESTTGGVSDVNSAVLREISDVIVTCNLGGTLSAPTTSFEITLPANSPVKNNPTVDNKLKTINRDQNEVSKQSTYLIVFKSFAPQAAIVTSDLNQELLNNTISGVINAILSNSVQNFFYKLFGSSVDVNFNYSRVATNIAGTSSSATTQNTRENVSLEFIKSLVNNRLIITFGSDFNFNAVGSAAVANQNFLFLPDVNLEYKITPDGKFRASFFYRSSFDVLSSSGRRDRTGGNISFRTEFDHLIPRRRNGERGSAESTQKVQNGENQDLR